MKYFYMYFMRHYFEKEYPTKVFTVDYMPIEWACFIRYRSPSDQPEKMFFLK